MTFLSFSSFDLLIWLEMTAEEEAECFMAWEYDLMLFLACWWSDLRTPFHLQTPWSFRASTAPMLVATIHALHAAPVLIFFSLIFWVWMREGKEKPLWLKYEGSGFLFWVLLIGFWVLLIGKRQSRVYIVEEGNETRGRSISCFVKFVWEYAFWSSQCSPIQVFPLPVLSEKSVVIANQNHVPPSFFAGITHVTFSFLNSMPRKRGGKCSFLKILDLTTNGPNNLVSEVDPKLDWCGNEIDPLWRLIKLVRH